MLRGHVELGGWKIRRVKNSPTFSYVCRRNNPVHVPASFSFSAGDFIDKKLENALGNPPKIEWSLNLHTKLHAWFVLGDSAEKLKAMKFSKEEKSPYCGSWAKHQIRGQKDSEKAQNLNQPLLSSANQLMAAPHMKSSQSMHCLLYTSRCV